MIDAEYGDSPSGRPQVYSITTYPNFRPIGLRESLAGFPPVRSAASFRVEDSHLVQVERREEIEIAVSEHVIFRVSV